jgi:uncharacterized phage protein (TIGR02220 family)
VTEQAGKPEKKSRYRKIEVRIWGDEKFKKLTPIPPCGQGLWLFLLTGPHTGPIPGLFRSGRAAMAEELDWSLEDFDKAFAEALEQDMVKADWKAKVVWVPNALKCNKPESPNVVTSWGSEWDLIPECDLKREAFDSLKSSVWALGEGFGKAFDKAFSNPNRKASGKAISKTCPNQEQEQEQEGKHSSGEPDIAKQVLEHLNEMAGRAYQPVDSSLKLIRARLKEGATPEDCIAVIDAKTREWLEDPKMNQYLRPETLFNATKFAGYVGQLGADPPTGSTLPREKYL